MVSRLQSLTIILGLIWLIPADARSESLWVRYGWQAFSNVSDARSIGLGGAFAAGDGNVAQLGNPAGDTSHQDRMITYSHQSRFSGIVNNDLLAFNLPFNYTNPIGLVLIHENIDRIPDTGGLLLDWGLDGMPGTGDPGEGNGILDEGERLDETQLKYFSQRQIGLHLSTSWKLGSQTLGLAVKGLNHSLGENSGNGIGFDLGLKTSLWNDIIVGLTVRDVLTSWMVWDSGTIERTAPSINIGLSRYFHIPRINFDIAVFTDAFIASHKLDEAQFELGSKSVAFSCGMELILKDKLQLRLGRDQVGLTAAGVGLRWQNFGIDYASRMEPDGSGLGTSHYLSFNISPTFLRRIGNSF